MRQLLVHGLLLHKLQRIGTRVQLLSEERMIVAEIARRLGVAPQALADALEHESPVELAAALHIDEADAAARLEPVRRTAAIGDDWGAGCKLLTDEMRADLRAALWRLAPASDHSVSSGVSHG
jgi:hypothetical protein